MAFGLTERKLDRGSMLKFKGRCSAFGLTKCNLDKRSMLNFQWTGRKQVLGLAKCKLAISMHGLVEDAKQDNILDLQPHKRLCDRS